MTRGEAIKDFFCKTLLPAAVAALMLLHLPVRLREKR